MGNGPWLCTLRGNVGRRCDVMQRAATRRVLDCVRAVAAHPAREAGATTWFCVALMYRGAQCDAHRRVQRLVYICFQHYSTGNGVMAKYTTL